ncbi:MAG: hypothetical protein ABSG05_00715 [Candidatus Pacearchaeota archaeon]|jgi:hypothetical protein
MAKAIPKWVQERLSRLWKKYEGKDITYENIEKTLTMDDKNTINAFLNELKTAGWIEVKSNESDARKKIYILKSPSVVMLEIKKEEK